MRDMQSFILGIVVVSVTLVIGIYILAQIQGNFTAGTVYLWYYNTYTGSQTGTQINPAIVGTISLRAVRIA